jgi:antitoxin component YwqK of YwqJK toxin-antitoxin module
MHGKAYLLAAVLALAVFGCQKNKKNNEIVSQTYVHKYGYAVSQKEWDAKNYPGQIITSLRNGVTITATYEDGQLHGPYTMTYPHSKVVEKYILYNAGMPVKEVSYDIAGMPLSENTQLTQNRRSLTSWYIDGVPKSVEEYVQDELIEGQYFTQDHTLESQVDKGNGLRVVRDIKGILTSKDLIENGMMVRRDSFYANGSPESVAYYFHNQLHGTRKIFTESGEPIAVEDFANGHLHGLSTYYKNGCKELEVYYLYGKKHGIENQFLDGASIMHQITWEHGRKHGKETFFLSDGTKEVWNYEGREVSQVRFEELSRLEEILSDPVQ